MDAYSPFTHSVNNHSFRVDSDDPVLALGFAPQYDLKGLNIVFTAIPGGRHLRVADSNNGSGQFDNFAINASYRKDISDDLGFTVGTGWLNSTIYNTNLPHHPGPSFLNSLNNSTVFVENGAWDIYGELRWKRISIGGEFTSTQQSWPAGGAKVTSLTGQIAYDFALFDLPTRLSFVYGVNRQGPDDTNWEQLKQVAVGLETQICDNFSLGIEYVRNSAFVPLIALTRVSDPDVRTDTVIIGGKIHF